MRKYPSDWPQPGPIDLDCQDRPHDSSTTEWWYTNCHLKTVEGRELSLFAAFFRIVHKVEKETGKKHYAYSVTWALSDPANKAYFQNSLVDKGSPGIALERIKAGQGPKDPRLKKAVLEVLERGRVPTPDRMFEGDVSIAQDSLKLDFDGNKFERRDDGSYLLTLSNSRDDVECELVFAPIDGAVRQGNDGVVRGMQGEDMFYYFLPRCEMSGKVILKGENLKVASGCGWYDHEFGGYYHQTGPGNDGSIDGSNPSAWNWTGIQLDDGRTISAYSIVNQQTGKSAGKWLVKVDSDGRSYPYDDMVLEPLEQWRSTRTFTDYPVAWRLTSKDAGIDIILRADFNDQEFVTIISKPAFWEGRCTARGTIAGREVTGLAFMERSGFEPLKNLDDFFMAVGETVRNSVKAIIPLDPTHDEVRDIIASKEREHYMEGVDTAQVSRALFKPVREITDRGGKAWRSYGIMVCCDVVGGDSRKYVQWLSLPEFLHVGSLIVDDVEDGSTVRRGGPACHLIYGQAKAINAGSAAYFLGQKLLHSDDMTDADKLRIYDIYFEALRAGHAGQAIDLDGADEQMEIAVKSGDSSTLELQVNAWQRLKTAVPAASLARIGAIGGKGSEAQVDGLGRYFEDLGLSFQIIDDVLNLRGFKGDLKVRGEDITAGKVTLPVAKAMSRLSAKDREWLWELLKSKTEDQTLVAEAISKMEECGALDACMDDARKLLDDAWARVEPMLADSIPKIMLRAFSLYLLERHY